VQAVGEGVVKTLSSKVHVSQIVVANLAKSIGPTNKIVKFGCSVHALKLLESVTTTTNECVSVINRGKHSPLRLPDIFAVQGLLQWFPP
jgi:hypothetical protein